MRSKPAYLVLGLFLAMQVNGQSERQQLNDLATFFRGQVNNTDLHKKIVILSLKVEPRNKPSAEATSAWASGIEYFNAKQFPSAVAYFRSAVELAPWWPEAIRDLAYAEERAGQLAMSEMHLAIFLLTNPAADDAQNARTLMAAIETREKIMWEQAQRNDIKPETFIAALDGATYTCQGQIHIKQGVLERYTFLTERPPPVTGPFAAASVPKRISGLRYEEWTRNSDGSKTVNFSYDISPNQLVHTVRGVQSVCPRLRY